MPKKHRQTYQTKPGSNYVHPSLGGSGSGSSQIKSSPTTLSVNERLSNLRLGQSSPASTERKRELAELSNQRSLPPSLGQGILGLPASVAPNPRINNALRSRIRLRTPGPAPPPSWNRQSTEGRYHSARRLPRTLGHKTGQPRNLPDGLAQFMKMTGSNPVLPGSLLDMTLRQAAVSWNLVIEDCVDFLDVIPAHLRALLLSYLTTLGPPEGIDMHSLQALFPVRSDLSCLDLSGLVGWGFSLKELRRWLHRTGEEPNAPQDRQEARRGSVLDSWDQEALSEAGSPPAITSLTTQPKFDLGTQYLTKLSLAHPPSSISWTDLLSMSRDLHALTHLNLADWPLPTRTPNMTSPYAAMDRDFHEPSLVLRILANNTPNLHWLSLQGCHEWLGALLWSSPTINTSTTDESNSSDSNGDWNPSKRRPNGPDFNGSWRHITYLNIAQDHSDWRPQNCALLKSSSFRQRMAQKYFRLAPAHQDIIDDLREYLIKTPSQREWQAQHCTGCHDDDDAGDCSPTCGACISYQDNAVGLMARWLEREVEARNIARGIAAIRSGTNNPRCTFDHGWQSRQTYPRLPRP